MLKNHLLYLITIALLLLGCDKVDSEQDFLNKINEIATLQELAKNNVNDSTLIHIAKAQKIIDSDNRLPDTLLIENIFRKGHYYKEVGQFDSAMYYFHKTIDLIEGPNTRKRNIVYFRNTWETEEFNNNFANAITVAQKFIDISNSKDNIDDLVFGYNFLERVSITLGNYKKSLYYNSKTLEAAKQSSDINMYVITGNSKAHTLYYYLKQKKEAFKLLDSLSVIKCDKEAKRQLYRTYGILNHYEENYSEAIKYYKKVLKLSKEAVELKISKIKSDNYIYNYNLLESYNNLTEAYLDIKEYELAENNLDSTKIIIDSNSEPYYVTVYNKWRFILNYRTNTSEKELLKDYLTLIEENKKLHQKKINEKLYALESANKKERIAIAAKNKSELKNVKLIALLVFSGLLMLVGYLLYRQRRYQFQKQEIQMQQRLLRSQMNPHFTFNTLSVIQNQMKENQEVAVNYLLKFSRLLRLILENSLHDYVQVENELELIRKYMDIQLLRFPKKFNYNIILENFEEDELLFIPPMLIQPFIENSIEHGFLGIAYQGQINITLKLQDKWISCVIEDNGVGLKESNNSYKKSISTKLISNFILKTTKQKISIANKNNDRVNDSGVLVKFLIPYKFSEND